MIYAFPKIFHLGHKNVNTIFDGDVEITEKVDGSQFNFGVLNGELYMKSKGAIVHANCPENLFAEAVEYVLSIKELLREGFVYHCEYLKKPKHNVLCYNRIPKNHLICFGISKPDGTFNEIDREGWCNEIGIEHIPVLYHGQVDSVGFIKALLDTDSTLGNTKVEGVVIKNYNQQILIGNQCLPIMSAKYVSEKFKERHGQKSKTFKTKGRVEDFVQSFRTEARWQKAVQHIRERGELDGSPKDIGVLMREVHKDIVDECRDEIINFLWCEYIKKIKRVATAGLAEWYKEQLAREVFNE